MLEIKKRSCVTVFTGRKKPVSATPKEMEWAQMACHRCLVYLGDLGNDTKIQNALSAFLSPACGGVRQLVCPFCVAHFGLAAHVLGRLMSLD